MPPSMKRTLPNDSCGHNYIIIGISKQCNLLKVKFKLEIRQFIHVHDFIRQLTHVHYFISDSC